MLKVSGSITIILIMFITCSIYSQTYDGPSIGSVDTGAVVILDNTFTSSSSSVTNQKFRNVEYPKPVALDYIGEKSTFTNYVYVDDKNVTSPNLEGIGVNFMLHNFAADKMTNSIPPDPTMAVGPNHVITAVNSEFSIWDRSGKLLKHISASQWWQAVWPNESGDPQVVYDHFANRWILVWLQVNDALQTSGNLIAYSDDDDPFGTWYLYRLDTKMHGTVNSSTWGDYPHVGYDDKAIYISTNCFNFSGGFAYAKIRIINKNDFYSAEGGPVTYTDIWNISLPNTSTKPISIQPAISYSPVNDTSYFAWNNSGTANFYVLYRIINPLTNPVLVGTTLPVPRYYPPPGGQQLGGGTEIENLSRMTSVPVYRDGKLYAVHAIRNSTSSTSSSLKYFVVDVYSNSVIEQVEQGADGYFYLFPSITVDKDHNIAITYSRSATSEYIGSYYSTKLATDPPGLSPSQTMVTGKANYVVTFSGSTNRWGDYLAAGLDPANQYNIWLFSEYAVSTNRWETWLTEIRMKPYDQVSVYTQSDSIRFKNVDVGVEKDTQKVIIANYGNDDLIINSIDQQVGPFTLISNLNYPITLSTFDSLSLEIEFNPDSVSAYSELMEINDNDPNFDGLKLNGIGFHIFPANTGSLYASTGVSENGKILTIDKSSGAGTELGLSSFSQLSSLTINPLTNIIYGIYADDNETNIVRVNATAGDAFLKYKLDLGFMESFAFDTSGILYGAVRTGEIYAIDLSDGSYTFKTKAGINITSIAFNPLTNDLWAAPRIVLGSTKDRIYKIDLETGSVELKGETGFDKQTNDLAFDENGVLYGVVGGASELCELITIDTSNALGTSVGSIGYNNVTGLAYARTITTDVKQKDETGSTPKTYFLSQNYPNPFNPTTTIKFTVPVTSNVTLTVYNILGQIVSVLANEEISAGNYSYDWNGTSSSGVPVSSGIYFYELKAKGNNGTDFSKIMKMVFLK